MSSGSILDLSLQSRASGVCGTATAADISSSALSSSSRSTSRRLHVSPTRFTPALLRAHSRQSAAAELCTEEHDNDAARGQADTSSHDDVDTDDKQPSHAPSRAVSASGSSSDVSDDVAILSRDVEADRQRLRHRPSRDQPYQYLDYQQAAAAAAAASRFLLPFPFPSPTAAGIGNASTMTSPIVPPPSPFYPLSFPALPTPLQPEAAIHFGSDSSAAGAAPAATSCHVSSRSSKVRVKEDEEGAGVGGGVSDHVVDPTYAERRRKNNEAARRSRDARRMKERETCLRAALLQQENVRLRAEMTVLKTEITRLHCLLYDKM